MRAELNFIDAFYSPGITFIDLRLTHSNRVAHRVTKTIDLHNNLNGDFSLVAKSTWHEWMI